MTLKLTLTVTYNPNGVSEKELAGNLRYLAEYAMGNGILTGETGATVEAWEDTIERVDA